MAAISDNSPLILYAGVGCLDLLRDVFDELVVPAAVWYEVVAEGSGRHWAAEVVAASWIRRRDLMPAVGEATVSVNLGAGETEVLTLVVELGANVPVLLDDRKARQAAAALGLTVIGSGGVLVLAKDRGLVTRVQPMLDDLRHVGLHLSERAVGELLRLAGEA